MARSSRARLLELVAIDYRPDAWRRQQDVEELLSQFHVVFYQLSRQHRRWIPYSMQAVEEVHEALQDGRIQPADVTQVLERSYFRALGRNRTRVTKPMIRLEINHQVHLALVALAAPAPGP